MWNTTWKVRAHGVYERDVDVSERCKNKFMLKYRTKHFPCGFVFSIHVEYTYREIILSAFCFKDFQSAKMINLLLHIVK